jgi:hypothetical protein
VAFVAPGRKCAANTNGNIEKMRTDMESTQDNGEGLEEGNMVQQTTKAAQTAKDSDTSNTGEDEIRTQTVTRQDEDSTCMSDDGHCQVEERTTAHLQQSPKRNKKLKTDRRVDDQRQGTKQNSD